MRNRRRHRCYNLDMRSAPFNGALRILVCLPYLDRPTCGCRLRDANRCTPADYPTSHSECITTNNDADRQTHTTRTKDKRHAHTRTQDENANANNTHTQSTNTAHTHTHTRTQNQNVNARTHTNTGSTRAGNVSVTLIVFP